MLYTCLLGPVWLMCKVLSKWRQMIKTKLLTEVSASTPSFWQISFFQMLGFELGTYLKKKKLTRPPKMGV